MMEFDDEGRAIDGTYAISTVEIAGAKDDGTPVATITSAVCDVCQGWASALYVSGATTVIDDGILDTFLDTRIRRRTVVIVYACPKHSDQVADALTDEYGWAVNRYEPDDLAVKVDKHGRLPR